MERAGQWLTRNWAAALGLAVGAAALVVFWPQAAMVGRIVLGGGAAAMLLEPLAGRIARKTSRPLAAALAVAGAAAALGGVAAAALPVAWKQGRELIGRWDDLKQGAARLAEQGNGWLAENGLPRIDLSGLNLEPVAQKAGEALQNTAQMAGKAAQRIGEAGMMALIAFYMLRDMDSLTLRLEWLMPKRGRMLGLKMAAVIRAELGAYLRGQLMIALSVGALAAAGMWIAGTPGFLVLGGLVGIFNMIPYFGPVIGGIPAALSALGQGAGCAIKTVAALLVVQQIDGYVISPRFMGESTGLHPAFVLLGIAAGGSLAGAAGMLLAVPGMLSIRAIARIWSLRREMI